MSVPNNVGLIIEVSGKRRL